MGIDPGSLTEAQLRLMQEKDRKKIGLITKAEALRKETSTLERKIHDQFTNFCKRYSIDYWHSSPVRKSSIGAGLPDFLCLKNGRAICIEFKVLPNKLSAVQEKRIADLLANGNPVYVCEENEPGAAYSQAVGILTLFFKLRDSKDL